MISETYSGNNIILILLGTLMTCSAATRPGRREEECQIPDP